MRVLSILLCCWDLNIVELLLLQLVMLKSECVVEFFVADNIKDLDFYISKTLFSKVRFLK